jgi:hypothetical protein
VPPRIHLPCGGKAAAHQFSALAKELAGKSRYFCGAASDRAGKRRGIAAPVRSIRVWHAVCEV